jgi:CHASE3 domain sensor protein
MRIIILLVVAIVMFAGAAGASWWWQQQSHAATEDAAHDDHGAATHAEAPASEHAAPAGHAPAGHAAPGHAPAGHAAAPPEQGLPVAVRAKPMSVEELLRYGLSLNAREETLEQRELEFREREARLKLALADLQGEQSTIDALRAQVQQQLVAADAVIAKIQEGRQELSREQTEAKAEFERARQLQQEISADELTNIKKLSTWLRAMEPAKSADILREMANDGRMETAARILSYLEEREAGEILEALPDTTLVDDLIQQYLKFRPQAKPPTRK